MRSVLYLAFAAVAAAASMENAFLVPPGGYMFRAGNLPNSGSFSFVPPPSLIQGKDYTIEIIDDTDPSNYNFTPTFTVDGATGSPTGSPTTSRGSTTTSEATTTTEESTSSTPTTTPSSTSASTTESSSSDTTMTTVTTSASTTTATDSSSTSETDSSTPTSSTGAPTGSGAPDPNGAVSLALPGGLLSLVFTLMALL
ncbi:extracellular serine-threonine rich protein [Microsporum canis CBS 113480]|uniref:Extracellular serine-threonine rich protein n=1 Tax=Arthroderma otae (strain ATCC MYA-4605 / CBS 113480) TaxID=554155 RepID=C5FX24_ARTOC|nr:extracellular serine-threonine rich protein [Microsporum canis CBS 113480]EEQ34864.1 extracellular serine-threonine rich protein [Microsporum canis CBS 113480]